MRFLQLILTRIYARLLHLYPNGFKREFLDEMQLVFENTIFDAAQYGILSLLFVSMRELRGVTISILRELWYEYESKRVNMKSEENENLNSEGETGADVRHALLATLPFALFGLTCMLAELELPVSPVYAYLTFSIIVLVGLGMGLAVNFPLWGYSYLGWSIVMTWWWMMMPMSTFGGSYSTTVHYQMIGWRSWLLLMSAAGIGLLLARSDSPIRRMIHGIKEDWTLLSFMMYIFVAFTQLIYDENHHPYLAVFMLGSTLIIFLGAWFYVRNTSVWKKIGSLLSGFVFAYVISYVCYATWDWAAYHGFPEAPPQTWYVVLRNTIEILLIWSVFLFWPAIIGLAQHITNRKRIA